MAYQLIKVSYVADVRTLSGTGQELIDVRLSGPKMSNTLSRHMKPTRSYTISSAKATSMGSSRRIQIFSSLAASR